MDVTSWDTYLARLYANDDSARDRALDSTQSRIASKIGKSLSCKKVYIDNREQTVTILNNKSDPSTKRICALPGEGLVHGGLVDFADNKWLITEVDADTEVYATGKMRQCNHVIRWLNDYGDIIEKWCIVEGSTFYNVGEKENNLITVGDARMILTIRKDEDTVYLKRGQRFMVGDSDAKDVLVYEITRPDTLYNVYNGNGCFQFLLNEVNMTDNDNQELRIADYYNHPAISLSL